MSNGNEYAADIFTVDRKTPAACPLLVGVASQKRMKFGLSRGLLPAVLVSPSQLVDSRRSMVTPPNSRYFEPRAFAVNSSPLYVVLFCVENVMRLSVATPTFAELSVYIVNGWPDNGSLGSVGVLML